MDNKRRTLLQRNRQALCNDLDVKYILDELFTKSVISNDEFDQIYSLTKRSDRVKYLIDTLLQNGTNNSYDAFVDTLMKDYRWLWDKFMENNEQVAQDSFEDSISRANVPRVPQHYVERRTVELRIAEELRLLVRHKILVLYGMSGCGKTTAAISVLRNNSELITSNFNGVVYWLNFGNCKTEDEIIAEQNKLYRKASSSNMHASISMSSIGSNADSQSFSNYDWTWQEMRDRLKSQFSEPAIKDALLVLDELNDKKCLDAFDIGCKILVTTRDADVVASYHPQIIKIENSFSESESLQLFSSCIDVDVKHLPRQAKKLHEICKGIPFYIALIGAELAQNKEKLVHDTRHWNYYLKKLERKEFFFYTKNNDQPIKAVEFCINSLPPDILPLFKMLTVLPENAKFSAPVLNKLWGKDVSEVDSIMKQLTRKSLIISIYDQEQRNYIYEIHDLIMGCLKNSCSEEELKKLHCNLLKNYGYDVINAPVEIEDDGYIAFYIGYHILRTKNQRNMWSLFGRLFLDLRFLGNKVRLTGPGDVISDLQKYNSYIAEHNQETLLLSIIKYLSTHGADLYKYPYTDIIQSILQHENKGILYNKACEVAQERCAKNELYFEFLHEQNVEEITPSTIDVKQNITSVCFLRNDVLVGTNGVIKFFDISTNKLKKELTTTSSPIKWIGACPKNPPLIAALGYDGVIKIWYIDDVEQDHVIEEEAEDTTDCNWGSTVTITPKLGHLINCRWANNDKKLFAHTSSKIIVYSHTGQVLKEYELFHDREILCCIPCNYDRGLVVATMKGGNHLEIVDLDTKEREIFEETDTVLNIIAVPGTNRVLTLKPKDVTEYELRTRVSLNSPNCNNCRCKTIITYDEIKDCITFISIAVNKNGTLLFVSTDDSRIICVDLKNYTHVFDLENRRGNVVSMAVSEVISVDDIVPGVDVLLTGTEPVENSVKVWFLDASYVSQKTHKNGNGRLTTKFDVSFAAAVSPVTPVSTANTPKRNRSFDTHSVEKPRVAHTMSLDRHALKPLNLKGISNGDDDSLPQPLLAVIDDRNRIQISRGKKLLTEISPDIDEQITTVKISPCNHYIIYGLRSGIVQKYTLRSKQNVTIMDLYSPVRYLNFVSSNIMIVAGENKCLMAYRLMDDSEWKTEMLQRGNANLGSQEILNDMQGMKIKKSEHQDRQDRGSSSSSNTSICSSDRYFPSDHRGRSLKESGLIDCYWLKDTGLITVEDNATVKLWDENLKLKCVLNGRQKDVCITCSALEKNVLVMCDSCNRAFQTFELRKDHSTHLYLIQDYRLNNRIMSCDLTADGNILAMGLDSGDVVLWNVPNKRQLRLLKHHKSKVQWCCFSPTPDKLYRSTTVTSPSSNMFLAPSFEADDEQPPLVLVTMASEIVWWNVTYVIRTAHKTTWRNLNVITPIASPLTVRNEIVPVDNANTEINCNFFFGGALFGGKHCWKENWKHKKSKEGSKRQEMLACIKLSGINAEKICIDDKFSCFVTVDNAGHIHIMNLLMPRCT
ncbi:uncharacterized protein Dark isoform X2 [Epargyreus clarus]|uniref:uncharacterized protein Dark isoform X2 n=1 Tax=Epargyreus clarus TaxID=520877 RepID=UPI003C2E47BE